MRYFILVKELAQDVQLKHQQAKSTTSYEASNAWISAIFSRSVLLFVVLIGMVVSALHSAKLIVDQVGRRKQPRLACT